MALVKCVLCGSNVNTTTKNYVFANEIHQHLKCPKSPVLDEQEKKDFKELTDAVDWAIKHKKHPRADWDSERISWQAITRKIKKLKSEGYSYSDQLYALKHIVEEDGGFWGYGRIESQIQFAIRHREKMAEHETRRVEYEAKKSEVEQSVAEIVETRVELKVTSKPTFMDDIDDDLSWL